MCRVWNWQLHLHRKRARKWRFLTSNSHPIHYPNFKVYRGYHKTTKQPAAIKVVDYSSLNTSKAIEYHTNERDILQALDSHDNIVKLYDLLVFPYFSLLTHIRNVQKALLNTFTLFWNTVTVLFSAKFPWLFLGGSLDTYIRKKPLNEHQVRRFMLQLANGLALLEKNNIIHRDLKPQVNNNFFVCFLIFW